jgi:tetratricopeptide (TPR) repeat protein
MRLKAIRLVLGIGLAAGWIHTECQAKGSQQATPAEHADLGKIFQQGQEALQAGELDKAEANFRKVLRSDPRAAAAYVNLGVIEMRRKNWENALRELQHAEKLAPKMSGIRLNIGLVYYRQGDYVAAIPALTSVLREQPDSEQARYLLGLCNLFIQNYGNAVELLEPLWPKKSDDFMYLYALSITANASGRKELDEKALTRLVEVGGDSPEFHLMLGKAFLNRQETEKAISELERAAIMNQKLPFVHFNLGMGYARTGDMKRAEEEFRRDIAIEPDLADPYEMLGDLYVREGKEAEAEDFYNQALQRNSRMAGSHFGIAKICLHQEKYEQALAAIDSAEHFAPDNQSVRYLRGQILSKLGRKEEAQVEFAKVKKITGVKYDHDLESFREEHVPNPELTRQSPP